MDFFQAQQDAHRKTLWLVLMMGAAVISLVLMAAALVALMLWYSQQTLHMNNSIGFYFTPEVVLLCLLIIGGIILTGSLIKLSKLGRGADLLIIAMGGRCVQAEPESFAEVVLRNLVEEVSIACGAPVPRIYILDDEPSINAFAAGFSLNDAALGFTRGCVERLSRDELEGVVAHEFSHLVYGDSRLNLKLMGVLHGITMISQMGYQLLRSQRYRSRSNKNGAALSLVGIGLLVVGYSGVFFASLIRSAVSRQREFLADASAVQYTRNTEGLADALKRIGGFEGATEMVTPMAVDASHMMFSQAVNRWFAGLFNTHPPVADRIQRLQPGWSGDFLIGIATETGAESGLAGAESGQTQLQGKMQVPGKMPGQEQDTVPAVLSALSKSNTLWAAQQVSPQRVGNAGPIERKYARQLIAAMPAQAKDLAHHKAGCRAVIFALLLSPEGAVREKQLRLLRNELSGESSDELFMLVCRASKIIDGIDSLQRLPLLNMALATRKLDKIDDVDNIQRLIQQLIAVDGKVSAFEWALQVLVSHQLNTSVSARHHSTVRVARRLRDLRLLFSYLISVAKVPEGEAIKIVGLAYQTMGVRDVGIIGAARLKPSDITQALLTLDCLAIKDKKNLMTACRDIVLSDDRLALAELELLRTIAEVLGCPLPLLQVDGKQVA